MKDNYSVIVVGGGHAGVEAAHICAKMGESTLLITLNFQKVANMPCNPSIGGSAKGIVVREIDALGGLMGKAADHDYLQLKMLNTGKGPGVQCLRAQQDKLRYPAYVLSLLENTNNLDLTEGMVTEIIHDGNFIQGVKLADGRIFKSKAVILTTGTYMQSDILVGHEKVVAGPDGEKPSLGLSPFLKNDMGLDLLRLKTGTPQRIKRSSVDFSKMKEECGTDENLAFSYETTEFVPFNDQYPCYLIYTTPETHQLIRDNLDKSAMYGGMVEGVGPRYCPSIEDKIVRFSDKPRHQLFLEPESKETDSLYLQGFSTSMPRDVQLQMVHTLPGLENAIILKYAYAIEYDALDPLQFDLTLMVKKYPGLYIGGQICGTSGYEEAGGLGLVAGINAVLRIREKEPFILRRDEAYIGVMIDDIVNKGTKEPYRLLSSRAEFRLLLRHDNADLRLRGYAHNFGTISDNIYNEFVKKNEKEKAVVDYLNSTHIGDNQLLDEYYTNTTGEIYRRGVTIADIVKHPGIEFLKMFDAFPFIKTFELNDLEIKQIEIMVKYDGYIKKQKKDAEKLMKLESIKLSTDIDYLHMDGLALEARSKLQKIKPTSIGQASRISGVNPADITILNLHLAKQKKWGSAVNFEELREKIKEIVGNEKYCTEDFLDESIIKFKKYYEFLVQENQKYNLTAITDESDVILKHFYDSILLLKFKKIAMAKIADIGTGAGFPGIPLLICNPHIKLTLIEPTTKKCEFLKMLCNMLELDDVVILNERAENLDRNLRGTFDIVTSRAVSALNILLELSIPFVKVNGEFIAYKSSLYKEEIADANHALKALNCTLVKCETDNLDLGDNPRALLFIKKNKKTEYKYPRNYSIIKSKPL